MADAGDTLGYLQSKGLQLKHAGPNEVHLACFFHGEDVSERGRLYINVDPTAEVPGCYICFVCAERGNLVTLKRHFGDEVTVEEDVSLDRFEIMQTAAAFYHRNLLRDYHEAHQYLLSPERGLTDKTIEAHQLGYAGEETSLYKHLRSLEYQRADILATGLVVEREDRIVETLRNMITVPYMAAGSVVTIRGRSWPPVDGRPKYKSLPHSSVRLFNSDITWNAEEIYVCEGEFDALVLQQLGLAAVAVAGANVWQDAWDTYFIDMRRVYVVFDRDPAGAAGAKKLKTRLGAKARELKLSPEGVKIDPTDWVARGGTAEKLAALVDEVNLSSGLLVTVRDALLEFEARQSQIGIKTGIELLDLCINPGLHPAQLMIILAKTGVGKTIALLNLMQRMSMQPGQHDMKFMFLSLEQTRGEWFDRARRIYRFYNLDATDREAVDYWDARLLIADKNRLSSDDVRQAIDDFDYRMGQPPDAIFMDYLGYWARSFKGDDYTRTSDAVMDLKELAKDSRIPIVTPHQVNRGSKDGEEFGTDAARNSGVVEETADFLFGIHNPDNALLREDDDKTGQLSLRILKSRHGGRGQNIKFQFAPLSLAMIPLGDPLVGLARAEIEYNGRFFRDSWQQAMYRHRTGDRGDLKGIDVNSQQETLP